MLIVHAVTRADIGVQSRTLRLTPGHEDSEVFNEVDYERPVSIADESAEEMARRVVICESFMVQTKVESLIHNLENGK